MKHRVSIRIVSFLLLAVGSLRAQSPSIIVTIPPPYSSDLSVWRSDPSRVLIILTGGGTAATVRISGYAANADNSVRIETKDDYPVTQINLGAHEVKTLNGKDLSLTDPNAARFTGTNAATIARTGQLPEGNYQLCLKLLQYAAPHAVLSNESCAGFTITNLDPAHLVTPSCGDTISHTIPQSINFSWVNPISTTPLQSRLQIIEVPSGQNAAAMFASGAVTSVYDQTYTGLNSHLYGPADPALTIGHTYGWRVQSIDPSHSVTIRNNGYSDVCTFTFGGAMTTMSSGSGTILILSANYPAANDTIPYLPPHLIVRFQPYSDSITQMDFTLNVTGSDGSHNTAHRVLSWPQGPRQGQGWPDASYNDRSTYIIADHEASGGGTPTPSAWASTLSRGVRYSWTVSANFIVNGHTVSASTPSQDFFIGVPPPSLTSPADNSQIGDSSQPVILQWNEHPPHTLNPPDVLGMGTTGSGSSMFFGATSEKWQLQLSKSNTFSTIDTTISGTPTSYHTGDACSELYSSHSHTLSHKDSGTYYWRVQWLKPDNSMYTQSPIWSFHIGGRDTSHHADTTHHADSTHNTVDTGACADHCTIAAIANHNPSTRTYAVNDSIHVGRFTMKLTTVSGTSSALTGEGTIQVPLIHAPVMVSFTSIKVNTADSMYDGEVDAKQAVGSPLTASQANDLGSALGLDTATIRMIQTFASQSVNLVSALTTSNPVGMPIGMDNTIGGAREVIGIIGMVFKPTEARLNAVMSFDIPDMGPGVGIGLGARDICFAPSGFGGDGKVTLYLATDLGYRSTGSWGFVFKAPTTTDSGTYVTFDCHGFKELRLAADVEFPRDWFKPDPDDGTSLTKAHFHATITSSGDWIAAAGLDKCTITGADGFGLEVQEMTYDHSDIRNPTGIVFPHNYVGVHDNTWHGFYIKRAAIRLPDELRTFDSTRPPTIAVTNLMINSDGFTASIRAENVIHYPSGNFGEWGASIDTIFVNVVSSSLDSGGMSGQIKIPISDSSLIYTASLSKAPSGHLAFAFNIHPTDTITAPLWIAKLYLLNTSHIDLTVGDSGFRASATLNGGFKFGGTHDIPVSLGGVRFESFQVMSNSPYLELGHWSFASPQHSLFANVDVPESPPTDSGGGSASGFPLSIHDINIVTGDRGGSPGFGLRFTISVNLMGGSGGISGGTQLSIWGKLASGGGPQHFAFDAVDLDSIGIHGQIAAILTVDGSLVIYHHDPTFGDGFRAAIHANFMSTLDVTAAAQFGAVNGYRYWYVDAKAVLSTGIPIFSGVGIYGFGGGVWCNMRMTPGGMHPSVNPSDNSTTASATPGATNSGMTMTPDNTVCFGFRAGVVIGTHPTSTPFNADVYFGASFSCDGSIHDITITGDGYMMASVTDRSSARVTAHVAITYNFPDQIFQGVFIVAINATPFTGGGQISIYADPHQWYIHIGEPTPISSRVHLSLASWLTINAYILIGQNLPAPPPLPPEVESILGPMPLTRNPALATGDGFAFGAEAQIGPLDFTFLIFYAHISAGLGFDIALLNFGPNASCEGIPGTMGMNGWYAMGQLYAYVNASIGLHVDIFFWSGDVEILSVAAAAALQGGAPNPTWFKGAVGGHYSVLDGAVTGSCHFEFKQGSMCVPVTDNPLAQMNLIQQVDPSDGSSDVDVYTQPAASLQFGVNQPFDVTETDADGNEHTRTFRLKINECSLHRSSSHANVAGHWATGDDPHAVQFIPDDLLQSRTQHTFTIAVGGEEYTHYSWHTAHLNNGSIVEQRQDATWTSGDEPDHLDARNIKYTYPLDRQRFFLQNECHTGYVMLKQGVHRPFEADPNPSKVTVWKARFIETKDQSQSTETDVTYNSSSKSVSFTLPTLKNSTAYCIQIIRRVTPRSSSSHIAVGPSSGGLQNRMTSITALSLYNRLSNTLSVMQHTLPGPNVAGNEHLLYYYYFQTSKYNTLSDKMASSAVTSVDTGSHASPSQRVWVRMNADELLDVYDMQGYDYDLNGHTQHVRPLIEPSARQFNHSWHTQFANPYIYDIVRHFGSFNVTMAGMNMGTYGIYPSQYFITNYNNTLASYIGTPQPLMADGEMLPPLPPSRFTSSIASHISFGGFGTGSSHSSSISIGSGSGGSSGRLAGSSGSKMVLPQGIIISYDQSQLVPDDWTALRFQAMQYQWMPLTNMSGAQQQMLSKVLSHPYEFLYNDTYEVDMTYWFCQEPDTRAPHVERTFEKGHVVHVINKMIHH